jgi:hypothetical protein
MRLAEKLDWKGLRQQPHPPPPIKKTPLSQFYPQDMQWEKRENKHQVDIARKMGEETRHGEK